MRAQHLPGRQHSMQVALQETCFLAIGGARGAREPPRIQNPIEHHQLIVRRSLTKKSARRDELGQPAPKCLHPRRECDFAAGDRSTDHQRARIIEHVVVRLRASIVFDVPEDPRNRLPQKLAEPRRDESRTLCGRHCCEEHQQVGQALAGGIRLPGEIALVRMRFHPHHASLDGDAPIERSAEQRLGQKSPALLCHVIFGIAVQGYGVGNLLPCGPKLLGDARVAGQPPCYLGGGTFRVQIACRRPETSPARASVRDACRRVSRPLDS